MKNFKSSLIAVAVVLGLWAFWHFYEVKGGESRKQAEENSEKVFQALDASKIDELTVQPEGGPLVHLAKQGEDWRLDKPVAWKADPSQVSGLTSGLAEARRDEVITETPQPAELKEYGLDPPRASVTFQGRSQAAQTLLFGSKNPTGQSVYARVSGSPAVFLMAAYLKGSLAKKPEDLRDKVALHFDQAAASRVVIKTKGLDLDLAKDKQGNWGLAGHAERVSQDKVTSVLSQFANLRLRDFVDEEGRNPGKYGLANPSGRVRIEAGGASVEMERGAEKDSAVYARIKGQPLIFTVDKSLFTNLGSKDDFIDKSAFSLKPFDIGRVVVDAGGTTRAFAKKDGSWDNPAIQPFLDTLAQTKYQTRLPGELRAAQAGLSMFDAAGKQVEEIRFGKAGRKPGTRLAYSSALKQQSEVPESVFTSIPK